MFTYPGSIGALRVLVGVAGLLMGVGVPLACASAATNERPPAHAEAVEGVHGFDFEIGEWRVLHHVLRQGHWTSFEGTCRDRALIDGSSHVEEHTFRKASGVTYGVGLRAYDAKSGTWAIWWVDSRAPHLPLDPPVIGKFENGVGRFYSDGVVDGKTIRTRYLWSGITPKSAHWEQATSDDGGKTWKTYWVMEFERIS